MGRTWAPVAAGTGGPAIQITGGLVNPTITIGSSETGFTPVSGLNNVSLDPTNFRIEIGGTWQLPVAVTMDQFATIIVEGTGIASPGDRVAYLGGSQSVDATVGAKVAPFLTEAAS